MQKLIIYYFSFLKALDFEIKRLLWKHGAKGSTRQNILMKLDEIF